MRITFIKENRDAGTESISTCDTAAFITRIKSETKPVNPEKPDVPLNKNDAFQKVQKRRVQEKR